jgi:DNA-binding PadR family transcriptional regulator
MFSESSQPSDHHRSFRGRGFHPAEPTRSRSGFGRGRGVPPGFGPGHGFGPPFGAGGPRGFGGPGGPRRRKGAARDAILSLLAEGPANGYGLIKSISDRTGGSWNPSPGSVYPTLQQLVDEGLIEPTSDDKRTEFQLTDAGRTYVSEHADELAKVLAQDTEHSAANADLHESVGKLMGVIQQIRFVADDDQRAQAITQLDDTRRSLYRLLGE